MKKRNGYGLTIKVVFSIAALIGFLSFTEFNWGARYDSGNNGLWAKVMAAASTPELPRVYLNTDYVPPSGRTITVNAGGDLQAAINQSQPGDVISLQAGATFTGNFTLPAKSGQGWIIIRSSTPDANLPLPGTRVTPQFSGVMPKINSPNTAPAIQTAAGAHHFRLIGLEVGISSGVMLNYGIVALGDGTAAQNTLSKVPQDIIIDRCYIHGNSTGDVSRGIALNSGRTAIIDSFISECHGVGFDTQAICGWNGPGPFKIVNNYLEGAGENFMLGGSDPSIQGLIPADIEFRKNYLYKPLKWKVGEAGYAGIHWSIKNIFELKNSERILIDGNIFENNWLDAQDGFAIVLKCANQDGNAPWSVTRDVTFTNNILRHSGAGVNLLGQDPINVSDKMRRVLIQNNLFEDIDGARWGGTHGRVFQITDTPDVAFDHNTVIGTGSLITVYGVPSPNFVYTNNISNHNTYGVKGDGVGSGNETINMYFPGAVFNKNIMAGGQSSIYPTGNYFPTSLSGVGFVNLSGGDYRLSTTSPYRNSGTDGLDLGCLMGQAMPAPSPTPSPTATPEPALAVTNVTSSSVTASSATISWNTNVMADSQVEYGTTTGYGQQTPLNTMMMTSHIESLSGLSANTLYNYRVKSRNNNGTLVVSSNYSFRTASLPTPTPTPTPIPTPAPTPIPIPPSDKTPPVIAGMIVNSVTPTTATIAWGTNEPATSQVEYGLSIAYGQNSPFDASLVANHTITIVGLIPGNLYNFRVKSIDGSGNLAVSANMTFVTPSTFVAGAVPVTWTQLNGLVVEGDILKRVSGCFGCPTSAVSEQVISANSGYLEFVARDKVAVEWVGLIIQGRTVGAKNMDFSIALGNEASVYERNRYLTEVLYNPGDVFRISIEGNVVKYYKNGVVFYVSRKAPTYPLVAGVHIDRIGGSISGARMLTGSSASNAVTASRLSR